MIEVVLNDRLGKKIRVKCNEDDTIGDLKKLAAAQLGTRPEKLKIQKWCVVWFSPTVFLVSAPNDGEIDGTPWQGSETFDIFNSKTHAWTWTNSPNSTGIPYIKTTLHLRTMRYTTAWGLNCEWNFGLETTSWNTSQLIFYWSDFARPSHVLANQTHSTLPTCRSNTNATCALLFVSPPYVLSFRGPYKILWQQQILLVKKTSKKK